MLDTKHAGDTIVTIDTGNIHRLLEHLLRLDEETRQERFCHPASDADVRDYVARLDLRGQGSSGSYARARCAAPPS
jgi:hypothetical protein